MKIRIASTIALAAAIALGATGCGLVAPQATLDPYAPSDGVEASVKGVDVRNLLLVAAEDGEHFNVVFTGVNTGTSPVVITFSFGADSASASVSAEFRLAPGTHQFGDPEGNDDVVLIALPDVAPGDTVVTYMQIEGAEDQQMNVPVLDGELIEYGPYVIPRGEISGPEAEADEEIEQSEEVADEAEETEAEQAE